MKMETHIPEDILIMILIGLPVKSLLRLKSICKKWYILIESPYFVTKHLQYQKCNDKGRVLLDLFEFENTKLKYMSFHDKTFASATIEEVDDPPRGDEFMHIVGSVDGLFCLFSLQGRVLIWNPSTRKLRNLPLNPPSLGYHNYFSVGFGLDPLADDYKVVLLLKEPTSFMVYSLQNNTWRQLDQQHFDYGKKNDIPNVKCVYLRGVCYLWNSACSTIITFDMTKEILGEIKGPNTLSPLNVPSTCLASYNDLLMVVLRPQDVDTIHTWMMEENGTWIKRFCFNILGEHD